MNLNTEPVNRRILVVDDNPTIHEDFRKILAPPTDTSTLDEARASLFEEEATETPTLTFDLDCADQGQAGFHLVEQAVESGARYAMAFIDMRMPPGWDGVETIEHIWQVDPDLEVVICTAFSDLAWEQILHRLGYYNEHLLILRKPFDTIEVQQLASALTAKWHVSRQLQLRLAALDAQVGQRTIARQEARQARYATQPVGQFRNHS